MPQSYILAVFRISVCSCTCIHRSTHLKHRLVHVVSEFCPSSQRRVPVYIFCTCLTLTVPRDRIRTRLLFGPTSHIRPTAHCAPSNLNAKRVLSQFHGILPETPGIARRLPRFAGSATVRWPKTDPQPATNAVRPCSIRSTLSSQAGSSAALERGVAHAAAARSVVRHRKLSGIDLQGHARQRLIGGGAIRRAALAWPLRCAEGGAPLPASSVKLVRRFTPLFCASRSPPSCES